MDDHPNITLWLRYNRDGDAIQADETRSKSLRSGSTILPHANQFWYKYTYMEEMLWNIAG
jgi:crooked neck